MRKPKLDDLVPVEGQILTGSLFSEPVRVATVRLTGPQVMLFGDPARLSWHEVKKVEHFQLSVSALTLAASGGARE